MIHTDILIIGAGPGGASAALFLAKKGIGCTILDKSTFPRDKICGDALSGKVVEVLKKLNPDLVKQLHEYPEAVGSWGVTFVAPNLQSLRVPFKKDKTEGTIAPGFISKRFDFDNWLITELKQQDKINLKEGVEVRKYETTADGIIAHTKTGEVYKTKLLIAADGAYSTFAKDVAGIKTEAAHNCFGLRAYYKNVAGLDADNFIELHFMNEILPGYFWIFPLPNGEANVGIGMRADKMGEKKVNLKKQFAYILEQNPTIKERFKNAELMGDIDLFGLPLGSKKRKLSGNNYLLLGDAAQLIDPFTGEGIGNAMMSGMYAAEQAEHCLAKNDFSESFMQQYDAAIYNRLWSELQLSYRMQQLVNLPSIFNFIVRKANRNKVLSETISCMFEDIDLRAKLKKPSFYFRLLFNKA